MNSKDNFYLLLSELDEEGVIKYGLIPYLKEYLKKLDLTTTKTRKIIDYFINLRSVYESFYGIIKNDDLVKQNHHFSQQFKKYNPRKKGEELPDKESEKKLDIARDKLAEQDILPFVKEYRKEVEKKIDQLENYLIDQNKSDSDIISLI